MLDANQRSALAIIRSLGRRGLEIIAGDHVANALGAASRYVTASVRYPDPAASPDSFVSEIISLAEQRGIDTIVPATDLTTMLLVSQPSLSKIARLGVPPAASYEKLTDKATLVNLAGQLGVTVPETRVANTRDLILTATHEIGFPIVLKPARSRYFKESRVVSTSVEIAKDHERLLAALDRMDWLADIPCLVQRFIPGHGAGIFAFYASGEPSAWFAHRRLREKPPVGGVSVLSESVPIDPVMRSAAVKLLSSAGWTGVAMIEFRVGTDGTPYLMEVNGRFWGSLQLAIDCGIDFPWLVYSQLHSLPLQGPAPYTVGKRLRWLLGDLDSLLIGLRRDPADHVHNASAIGSFIRSFWDSGCRQETLRLSDPAPGIRELANWLRALRTARAS